MERKYKWSAFENRSTTIRMQMLPSCTRWPWVNLDQQCATMVVLLQTSVHFSSWWATRATVECFSSKCMLCPHSRTLKWTEAGIKIWLWEALLGPGSIRQLSSSVFKSLLDQIIPAGGAYSGGQGCEWVAREL